MAALPLLHGAWLTAAVFSAANGLVLRVRIREEEAALARFAGTAAAAPGIQRGEGEGSEGLRGDLNGNGPHGH